MLNSTALVSVIPTQIKKAVKQSLFDLGAIVFTPGAHEAISTQNTDPFRLTVQLLARHITGDWGDLGDFDKAENDISVREGFRILSAYKLPDDTRIWIINEADRSATTLLLPSEY